jgi:molecular chaperone DnaJ
MAKNYYDLLGVSKSASDDEIKRAYRKMAAEHHPDRGGNAESFKEINEAYQVLSDREKRGQYDQYGQTFDQAQRQGGFGGGGFGGGNPFGGFDFDGHASGFGGDFDFGDIFSNIFGGGASQDPDRRSRGVDLEMPLSISFEESITGTEKEVTLEKANACVNCTGSGAEPGTKVVTCPKCHGSGQIKTQRRTILGTIATSTTCDHCDGAGKVPEKPCNVCKGSGVKRGEKKIKISVPAGIADGQRMRVSGEGEAGYRGSTNGDLYILIRVKSSPEFERDGFNLYKKVNVSFVQAALGDTLDINSVKGQVKIKIPAGTQSGKVFRISGHGVPYLNRTGVGDLFVTTVVKTPEKLSKKQKELLKQLGDLE